jgi:hypothetical protein
MKYRAHLYIEFSGTTRNQPKGDLQQLNVALHQAGWKYMGKRSFVRESDKLADVFSGIELIAKQASSLGQISFCNFQIVDNSKPDAIEHTASKNHPHALLLVRSKPFPSE